VRGAVFSGESGVPEMTCSKCSEMVDKLRERCEAKVRQMMGSEIGRHLLGAERELLLAAKSCLDAKVKWLDSLQQTPAESTPHEEST
jgi:hypothetical protein